MNNTIIHIGMPRTATTFFQQNVFPFLPNYTCYDLETTHFNDIFNQLQFADDTFYNKDKVIDFTKNWKNKNIVISNENFVGQSYFFNYINRSLIAKRLSEIFPDAKILLVLRNQVDLLASLYSIALEWRETKNIDDFIWQPNKDKNMGDEAGPAKLYYNTYEDYESFEGYDYLSLITLYKKHFKHVEVLLFEDFIKNTALFSSKLDTFFELETSTFHALFQNKNSLNEGVDSFQAKKLRKLNKYHNIASHFSLLHRIYVKLKRNILKKKRSDKKLYFSEQKAKELKIYFGNLNQQLAEKHPEIGIQNHSNDYYLGLTEKHFSSR